MGRFVDSLHFEKSQMSDRFSRSVEELLMRDTLAPMGRSLFCKQSQWPRLADRLREGYPGERVVLRSEKFILSERERQRLQFPCFQD